MGIVARNDDGSITIKTRSGSNLLQAHIKKENGSWHRVSTGTDDVDDALRIAEVKRTEMKVRHKFGLQEVDGVSFRKVCEAVRDDWQSQIDFGSGKPIFKTYIGVINKWLIPMLGAKPIADISDSTIYDFEKLRREKLGRELAKNTINTHNVVLRKVFNYAAMRKYIYKNQIPVFTVKDKGLATKKRPAFTTEEITRLTKYMERWTDAGARRNSAYKRKLLQVYVMLVARTGIRAGEEVVNIKWKDVSEGQDENGRNIFNVFIPVSKTRTRTVYVDQSFDMYFRILKRTTRRTDPEDYLFAMPDGEPIKWESEMFSKLLVDADLLYDENGERRTLYSLRHYFATNHILENRLAEWGELAYFMGTSVAELEKHYFDLRQVMKRSEYVKGYIYVPESAESEAVEVEVDTSWKKG
jgi:integrase